MKKITQQELEGSVQNLPPILTPQEATILLRIKIPNYTISIERSYKQGEDWKHTKSFFVEDLPKVMEAARDAYRLLTSRSAKNEPNGADQVGEEPAVNQ